MKKVVFSVCVVSVAPTTDCFPEVGVFTTWCSDHKKQGPSYADCGNLVVPYSEQNLPILFSPCCSCIVAKGIRMWGFQSFLRLCAVYITFSCLFGDYGTSPTQAHPTHRVYRCCFWFPSCWSYIVGCCGYPVHTALRLSLSSLSRQRYEDASLLFCLHAVPIDFFLKRASVSFLAALDSSAGRLLLSHIENVSNL